jgi:hypothetical protein
MTTAGWVYVAESTRANGSKKIYTGITTRSPYVRWGEHIRNVQKRNKSSWVGKGTYFKPIGAVWSRNAGKLREQLKV